MEKYQLVKNQGIIYRILAVDEGDVLLIDCITKTMPKWYKIDEVNGYEVCTEDELLSATKMSLVEEQDLSPKARQTVHERFTVIAGILPFVDDDRLRTETIKRIAEEKGICMPTVRSYLCQYLVYQDISALLPKERGTVERELTADEKNIRWALNKFYFTRHKNSLKTAYTYMLKTRYCDGEGNLLPPYPSFNQFRYFHSKYKTRQNTIISRNGIKDYQRNHRPLLGDGVQEFFPNVGTGMIDSTICDIYLVDSSGNLVGRPVLTIITDSYSNGFVMGYALTWEGGTYSLRDLMLNVIADKVEWCKKFGILIKREQWDSDQMPSVIVSDMGSEYQSATFAQITELGITLVNLPPLRPELKSIVEKSFQLLQESVKPYLMDHGYVDKDAGERLAPDYRKGACLMMEDYEKVVIRSILYHNSQRILEEYPYTEEMIEAKVQPHPNSIFEWGKSQPGCNLITVSPKQLILTLLPRVNAKFTRKGLIVFGLRYNSEEKNFTEEYLNGGNAIVAYNPESADAVYLLHNGEFIEFRLIESRFSGKSFEEIKEMQGKQRAIVGEAVHNNLQGRIDLASHVERIVSGKERSEDINLKGIKKTKKKAKEERHRNFVEEVKNGKSGGTDA
ncbi:MAG: transposase family protein [Acetatifactor sp.]|nr:transposase family protein [Acetatifactor sp.]